VWTNQENIAPGKFLLIQRTDGVFIDPFASVSSLEMQTRINQFARGWRVTHITWKNGLFGFFGSVEIYGITTAMVQSVAVQTEASAALNSFFAIAFADVSVLSADSLTPPPGEKFSETVALVATAVIVVALVWGISKIKEIIE
jgi:hypothetical protein